MRRHSLVVSLVLALGCSNAGEKIVLPEYYKGALAVRFHLDVDADSQLTQTDVPVPGVRIAVFTGSGTDTLRTGVTDATGLIDLRDLPLGTYRISINGSTIGDSVRIAIADTTPVHLLARLDQLAVSRNILLSFPTMTTAEARVAAPGRRVFILGKVQATPQSFHDGAAFIADPSGAMRITNATFPAGQAALVLGDSVRVLGTTGTDLGQPVIQNGAVKFLLSRPLPIARVVTVTEARTAGNGSLDAALVLLSGIKIADTANVNPDYVVTVANAGNPADQIAIVIDQLIDVVHANFKPGNNIVVRGVLVPKGDGTWMIRPRSAADITFPL